MSLDSIAFIGGGVMGEAIIKSLIASGTATPDQITVAEPVQQRCDELRAKYGVRTTSDNAEAVKAATLVVVAVKPQFAAEAMRPMQAALSPSALVISIMAGTTIASIRGSLHANQPVVRVMPNTPAQIGLGMSGWTATENVSASQITQTQTILRAMGEEVQVPSEHYIDMVTGVSGSGPGYMFLIIEAMIDAAVHLGFMRPVAEKLVLQTLKGSVEYAIQSKMHPAILRNQVTSAGGTTAAGLAELERGGLRTVIDEAFVAAYERAVELGKK
jgi:pyrroline-5-carboxylate reductase